MSQKYDDLLFGVRRSVRYHARREAFFTACHNMVMLVSALFATATIAILADIVLAGASPWLKALPAVAVTVLTLSDVVLGFPNKALRHALLRRRFIDLERKLAKVKGNPSPEDIAALTQELLAIEADEPPILRVLDTMCHNEQMRSMGYPREDMIEIGFWQRLLAPICDFREYRLHLG